MRRSACPNEALFTLLQARTQGADQARATARETARATLSMGGARELNAVQRTEPLVQSVHEGHLRDIP